MPNFGNKVLFLQLGEANQHLKSSNNTRVLAPQYQWVEKDASWMQNKRKPKPFLHQSLDKDCLTEFVSARFSAHTSTRRFKEEHQNQMR